MQYSNCRPGVSVNEMYTWGLSICTADLGSQYLNYRLGVLVFEMQTWGLTIGPPGLDNPGFKWLPNIHLLSIVSFSSNVAVPKFKTYHFLPRILSFFKEMLSHLAHKASLPTEQICSRHASLCRMQL